MSPAGHDDISDSGSADNSRIASSSSSYSDFSLLTSASEMGELSPVQKYIDSEKGLELKMPNLTNKDSHEVDIDVSEFWKSVLIES